MIIAAVPAGAVEASGIVMPVMSSASGRAGLNTPNSHSKIQVFSDPTLGKYYAITYQQKGFWATQPLEQILVAELLVCELGVCYGMVWYGMVCDVMLCNIVSYHVMLHYTMLCYNVVYYITIPYITLHYITLHYITLHYIILHYITSHCMMLYIYTYIYVNMC